MILNANPPQNRGLLQMAGSLLEQPLDQVQMMESANQSDQHENQPSDPEAASEILVLVLNGGPKWGFRIKQLNDSRVIVSRVDRGPAERSGLRVYDELLSVNQVELSDSPRSLLLNDYPEQNRFGLLSDRQSVEGLAKPLDQRVPVLAINSVNQVAADQTMPTGCELSKLDFAYQLIKHSSASNNNKLVLVVKRFLSLAYARASALAASNLLSAWNFSSSNEYRPSISGPAPDLMPMSKHQTRMEMSKAGRNQTDRYNSSTARRTNNPVGSNVYKCCDCYCDNGASGPSEDEENERQLFERLKFENHQRQLRQLEQQQHLRARQQQAQVQAVGSLREAETGAKPIGDGQDGEGPPPRVPERRSSRQAAQFYGGRRQTDDYDGNDNDDEELCLAPAPRLLAVDALSSRPPLPPPPPPPPPPPVHYKQKQVTTNLTGKRTKPLLPPPPPPRTRSCQSHQHTPKNIWSPSSSSVLSSSSPTSSFTSELESEQQVAIANGTHLEVVIDARDGYQTSQLTTASSNEVDCKRAISEHEDGDEDELATIVEREVGPKVSPVAEEEADGGASGADSREHQTGEVNDAASETRPMAAEAESNKKGVIVGGEPVDGDGGRAAPSELRHQQAGRKLRSFSVAATPNKRTVVEPSNDGGSVFASDNMGRVAGRGGLSSFIGAGGCEGGGAGSQARSLSIATTTPQTLLTGESNTRARVARAMATESKEAGSRDDEAYLCEARNVSQTKSESGELTLSQQKHQQQTSSLKRPSIAHSQQQPSSSLASAADGKANDGLEAWPQAPPAESDGRCNELQATSIGTADAKQLAEWQTRTRRQHQQRDRPGSSGQRLAMDSEGDEPQQPGGADGLSGRQGELLRRQLVEKRILTTTTTTTKTIGKTQAISNLNSRLNGNMQHAQDETLLESQEPLSGQASENQRAQQSKEQWFKEMYKQMHKPTTTAERSLLDAVNSQQRRAEPSTSLIKIKLKSPRSDHRLEPSYFSEKELERRSASPVFNGQKPGNICDYLPGQSSISQHERNLLLYHKIIEHINRVFSSVLQQTGETSRSTNALHACQPAGSSRPRSRAGGLSSAARPRSNSIRRSRRRVSASGGGGGGGGTKRLKQQAHQSQSGPQTPTSLYVRATKLKDPTSSSSADDEIDQDQSQHKRRCVFERLASGELEHDDDDEESLHKHDQYQPPFRFSTSSRQVNSLDRSARLHAEHNATTQQVAQDHHHHHHHHHHDQQDSNPRRQYVAVQQGHDIPLKGLRKPAPQPNVFRDRMFDEKSINIHYKTPTSRLLKMNTLNEYELNRIKKFYAQELINRRLRRSKSTRLTRVGHQQQQQQQVDLRLEGSRWMSPSLVGDPTSGDSPVLLVDPKRYQHALGRKARMKRDVSGPARGEQSGMIRFARALYDFAAKNEGELALKRGDLVEILAMVGDTNQWVRVEDCQSGLQGHVPVEYLDHRIGCAVAKRDVVSSRPGTRMAAESQLHIQTGESPLGGVGGDQLLPMSRGEPIVLFRRLSGHLYEASNTSQAIGLVWSNDLDIIKQPPVGQKQTGEADLSAKARRNCQAPANLDDYEAPRGLSNYRDEADDYLTDDDDDDDNLDDSNDDEMQLARCLKSIRDLDPGNSRAFQEVPLLDAEMTRRRRARSASGALNDENLASPEGRNLEMNERQQQYCTMRRSKQQQRQQVPCCQGRVQLNRRYCCDCLERTSQTHVRCPPRSSSSPQICPQLTNQLAEVHEQRQEMASETNWPHLYRARFAYKPRQSDELELKIGDILAVVQECDDGWLIGSSYTTKQTGTFPGNFVEPI